MIWLDMDGVVADFDTHYFNLSGSRPTRWPDPETVNWKLVNSVPDFYRTMPLMPGAHDLFRYAVSTAYTAFLTGAPRSVATTEKQKREWGGEQFGDTHIVCCPSREKYQFCAPGDVLVDDYLKYRVDWERAGGIFIHHTSADDSIRQLGELVLCGKLGGRSLRPYG